MSLRWVLMAGLLLLAGCVSVTLKPGCVRVGPYGQICPLPPAALPAVTAEHVVTIKRGKVERTILGRLQIDDKALRLAGASLFGTHLFTISYNGSTIVSKPANIDVPAKLVVAMLEVALAEPDRLRPRLHGLRLVVHYTASGETRDLYEKGRLAVHVERSTGPLARAQVLVRIVPGETLLRLEPLSDKP